MTRPHLYLPHISEPNFEPAAAKQDRILMDITGWRLIATPDQFDEFSRRLSGSIPFDEGEHRLFGVMSGDVRRARWKVIGGQSDGLRVSSGKPLIKGEIKGYLQTVQPDARLRAWDLSARVFLNPTRWIRSQFKSLRRELRPENWPDVPSVMFGNEAKVDLSDEVPIVKGTNVLISPRILSLGRPDVYPIQLRRYHTAAVQVLRDALHYAADFSGAGIELATSRYILREVETYWELQADNPVEAVMHLERPLRSLVSRSAVRWREVSSEAKPKIQLGSVDNSPVLRLKVAAGTDVRIYAKTSRRVRFEVLRRTKEIRAAFTSDQPEEFYNWMDAAARHASARLTDLMGTFTRLSERFPAQPIPSFRLITDIFAYLNDQRQADHIIGLLAASGQLVRTEAVGDAIDRLKAQGVLERVQQTGRDHVYHVTPKYSGGLALIRSWS